MIFCKIRSCAIFLGLLCAVDLFAGDVVREKLLLNTNWQFQTGEPAGVGDQLSYKKLKDWLLPTGNSMAGADNQKAYPERTLDDKVSYAAVNYDTKAWPTVSVPHDFGLAATFVPTGTNPNAPVKTGWYRKQLDIPFADTGKQFYLEMDGVSACPAVWLNGKYVGGWAYGYTSFRLDLTKQMQPGRRNVLTVRVERQLEPWRWYSEGGILRHVWLVKTAPIHVAHWGTTLTTPEVSDGAATITVKTRIENSSAKTNRITFTTEIYGDKETTPQLSSSVPITLSVPSGQTAEGEETFTLPNPKLWTPDTPNLYTAVTTVRENGRTVDNYETTFGVRDAMFTTNDGFYLNGKRWPIKGVNLHRDLGALGTVVNVSALRYRLELLKSMGCNAIRTAYAPASPELLDLCDRMGFLVVDELTDTWIRDGKANRYTAYFDEWHDKDIRALIRRDRNHPSVILWSLGSDVGEQLSPEGIPLAEKMTAIAHKEDPTRQVTISCNQPKAAYNGFEKTVDVFGINFFTGEYRKFHEVNSDVPVYASASAGTYSSRGEYLFPVSEGKDYGKVSFQVSSYDLYATQMGRTPDAEFNALEQNPYVAGEFVAAGFDYMGDTTPYNGELRTLINYRTEAERAAAEKELAAFKKIQIPSRSSYYGIFDMAGFPKDRYYLYQARWRPDWAMAHILPHWTWPGREGELTPVHVYTSGDEAELFLNGQSLGKKRKGMNEHRLRWNDVKYEAGELKVVAYKNGEKWAEEAVSTAGAAAKLELYINRKTLKADGQDLIFATVKVADAKGVLVPTANNLITFSVIGTAEVIATDNGDATSRETFLTNKRKAYNGLVLAVIRANKRGKITLEATAEKLTGVKVELTGE
jgi:beta-galactosidase